MGLIMNKWISYIVDEAGWEDYPFVQKYFPLFRYKYHNPDPIIPNNQASNKQFSIQQD